MLESYSTNHTKKLFSRVKAMPSLLYLMCQWDSELKNRWKVFIDNGNVVELKNGINAFAYDNF